MQTSLIPKAKPLFNRLFTTRTILSDEVIAKMISRGTLETHDSTFINVNQAMAREVGIYDYEGHISIFTDSSDLHFDLHIWFSIDLDHNGQQGEVDIHNYGKLRVNLNDESMNSFVTEVGAKTLKAIAGLIDHKFNQ